jgi:predicted RNA-binding protein YlqC (UPF0109 family)
MSDSNTQNEGADAPVADQDTIEELDYHEPTEEETRLIELVGFLVQGVVAHPEDVEVEEYFDDIGVVYGVHVHPEDVGRIIGKEGRIANALRQVVKAAATKTGDHVMVEIITEDTPLQIVDSEEATDAGGAEEAASENGASENGAAPAA